MKYTMSKQFRFTSSALIVPSQGMGFQWFLCLWSPIKVEILPELSTILIFVPSAMYKVLSADTAMPRPSIKTNWISTLVEKQWPLFYAKWIPLGYESLASLAAPPSPHCALSPGTHLWLFPTTASMLFFGSCTESMRITRKIWWRSGSEMYSLPSMGLTAKWYLYGTCDMLFQW